MSELPNRLEIMETPRSNGGRSARTSHNNATPLGEKVISDDNAFEQRQRLHLGSKFQVFGDLRNWRLPRQSAALLRSKAQFM